MATAIDSGFLRDTATRAPVTVDVAVAVAPFQLLNGFVRDANYALVTTTTPVSPKVLEGFQRENNPGANWWVLVANLGGTTVSKQLGLSLDVNYALTSTAPVP